MKQTAEKTKHRCTHEGCDKVCKSKQGLISHERSHLVPKEKLERGQKVDFNIETTEQANEICAHLSQMKATMGWIYLSKMLEASMTVIERQIITKTDVEGQPLSEDDVDTLRKSYLAYEELINKPDQLIDNISKGNVPTMPQYDPYAKVVRKDIENYSGVLDDEIEE